MNRLTVTFVVLAAIGGCMAADHDPAGGYQIPRRTTSQPWVTGASDWRGSDGKMIQTSALDSSSRPYATASGSMSGPRPTAAIKDNSPSSDDSAPPAVAKTLSAKSSSIKPKTEYSDALVKANYTTTLLGPSPRESASTPSTLPSATAKSSKDITPRTAEAKSPSVNLGVLRLLNSKRISFHYEVKDSGSAGVGGLELWGTKDMRSWKKYESVQRMPHSFVVDVKEEGLYGFTMMARGKEELTKNQPPKPGEAPQVWVVVDLTKPDVQLLGAELNIMSPTPGVVIRWTAKDTHLGPRPITLLYAERLEGPWTPLAANLENSGRYEWNMQACVPSHVYVRVQAIDMMGNIGIAQTATLHIPGRQTMAHRAELTKTEPPHLTPVPASTLNVLRPIAATVPNPSVSILSVDGE
jgi:hypothetical protein